MLRKVTGIAYTRTRISTPDGDFLDLDWLKQSSRKLIILSHGLEGSSGRPYIKGMAKLFRDRGYDVLAWNYRGCSEEMNHKIRFYHSGATEDLDLIVNHAIALGYQDVNLIGFSLGGNLTLKYLGEKASALHPWVKKSVVFSVPLNLHGSCIEISKRSNWIYNRRFLNSLKNKVVHKAKYLEGIDPAPLASVNSLLEFDDLYTAPIHGFKNALHYYQQCSSLQFVKHIQRPTLVVNALNDPFLSKDCFPDQFENHPYVKFEYPSRGGHVGFALFDQNGLYWSELRALQFIQSHT